MRIRSRPHRPGKANVSCLPGISIRKLGIVLRCYGAHLFTLSVRITGIDKKWVYWEFLSQQ